MARTKADALAWVATGTKLVLEATADLTDADIRGASTLDGWTVGNLVAHVAANADGLVNLATWARTGVETPMYAGPEDRAEGIARGDALSADELRDWLADSAARLDTALARLTDDDWQAPIVTAQGRTVPATEIPWLRSREVNVHAVDLGRSFGELPEPFLEALVEDICTKRGLSRDELPEGPRADVAAYLAGRPHGLVDAPEIGAWL